MKQKKSIEVVALGGALIVSLGSAVLPMDANAGVMCSLSSTGIGTTVTGDTASFVKVTFAAKCSPNTVVRAADFGTAFAVKGGSKKGSIVYGTTTEGGGGAVWCGGTVTYTDAGAAVTSDPSSATDGCS